MAKFLKSKKIILIAILSSWVIGGSLMIVFGQAAADKAEKDKNVEKKTVQMLRKVMRGHVGGKNNFGVALVYEQDATSSSELWLPFDKKLGLNGYGNLSDLEEGDEVVIDYDVADDGSASVAKNVSLIQKKVHTSEE